jgi:hypothetical protein
MLYQFNRNDFVVANDGNKGKIVVKSERGMLPFYYVELKSKMQHGYYETQLKKDETEIFKNQRSEKVEAEMNTFLEKEKREEILIHSFDLGTGIAGKETLFVGSVFYEDIQQKKLLNNKK